MRIPTFVAAVAATLSAIAVTSPAMAVTWQDSGAPVEATDHPLTTCEVTARWWCSVVKFEWPGTSHSDAKTCEVTRKRWCSVATFEWPGATDGNGQRLTQH